MYTTGVDKINITNEHFYITNEEKNGQTYRNCNPTIKLKENVTKIVLKLLVINVYKTGFGWLHKNAQN